MSSDPSDDDRTVIIGSTVPGPVPAPEAPAAPPAPPAPPATSFAPPSSFAPASRSFSPSQMAAQAASSAGDSGNALPLGTFLAEFELTSVLGEGGFGIVYQAWDHSLERKVALKEYMPASLAARSGETQVQVKSERHRETFELGRKSFINEARLLAQFDHPSLVKVYRFWEANGTAYMVMPLYEGITLKDRLRELGGGPPDESWLMGLLGPLTEALGVIHAERCYHRDIAPDNVILLAGSGRPLLLDFGAARRVIGDMTQALTVILKPGYAPIEQYAEAPHMKQGGWTDIYALAATIHFALVGKTPPPSVSRMMSDTYQPLAELLAGQYSERFLRAIDRALIVKPEERTQGIAELRADLGLAGVGHAAPSPSHAGAPSSFGDSTLGDSSTRLQPPAAAKPGPANADSARSAGSSKAPLFTGLAVLLLGGGAAAYFLSGRSAPPPVTTAPPPAVVQQQAAPAPVQAPTVAAPAPTARRFDAQEQFERVLAGQTPGFGVQAQAAKSQLRIGKDNLGFSISSTRAGYVQVLVLGPDGSLLQLFPNSQAKPLRIQPGQTLKLPQANWPLETVEPAGPEHFLVVVSEQPRDYAVLSTEREYLFVKLPTGERADALLGQWTLPTPMLLGTAPKGCQGADCEAYGAAKFTVEVVR
jgi:serine/threonine protein kinase